MSQAVFLVTNVRFGRHVNVSRDEYKKSRTEFRLSDLYNLVGYICTERNEGNRFFYLDWSWSILDQMLGRELI